MKSRKLLVTLLIFVALLSCIGSVGAYMRKQTEVVTNTFVPARVSCEVVETFGGGTTKTDIQVKNTSNIEAYLRLHLVTYWVGSNGDILYKQPLSLDNVKYDSSSWIKSGDTYYYKYPVQPSDDTHDYRTTDLLIENYVLTTDSDGNRQVVEVFAEAIQSKPTSAVAASWDVTITKNADGIDVITAVN